MAKFKSGFVAILGRPNVGKSTFLNYVLGKKVSIISPKPQTTRNRLQGIYTTDEMQIIFIDTPGIHKPLNKLGDFMNNEAFSTLNDADVVMLLTDATQEFGTGDKFVLDLLKKSNAPKVLIFNKMDLIKNDIEENIKKFTESLNFDKVFKISSVTGDNVNNLLSYLYTKLEEGPMYYPKDQLSDHPEQFIISEIIREKVLILTKEEVPHSIACVIENFKTDEENPNLININAVIVVERDSQKKIIIGKSGKMIKEIGTLARKDIVMFLGMKVYLEIWVRVEEKWRENSNKLKKLGYFSNY